VGLDFVRSSVPFQLIEQIIQLAPQCRDSPIAVPYDRNHRGQHGVVASAVADMLLKDARQSPIVERAAINDISHNGAQFFEAFRVTHGLCFQNEKGAPAAGSAFRLLFRDFLEARPRSADRLRFHDQRRQLCDYSIVGCIAAAVVMVQPARMP
jgi:hypothetical protein